MSDSASPAGAAARPASASPAPALWLTLAMGVTFALIWSSAFSFAKILVAHAPPFSVSALRFAVAGLLAAALAAALGQRLPKTRAAWTAIVVLGLCQNTLYLGLFFTAMTKIPAGLAAIVASAMPLLVASFAQALGFERIGWAKAFGLSVGFAGVVWVMGARVAGGADLTSIGFTIIGVLAVTVATLTVKRVDFGSGLLMVVALQMLVGAVGCAPIALAFEDVTAFDPAPEALFAFAYQVLLPGIAATLLWFALLKRVSAANASAFHFLNPVFGLGFAYALLGEPLSPRDAAGAALIAIGILIVNRAGRARG